MFEIIFTPTDQPTNRKEIEVCLWIFSKNRFFAIDFLFVIFSPKQGRKEDLPADVYLE